jgi:hypothetical protein
MSIVINICAAARHCILTHWPWFWLWFWHARTWLNQNNRPSFSPSCDSSSDTAWRGTVNQHVVRSSREWCSSAAHTDHEGHCSDQHCFFRVQSVFFFSRNAQILYEPQVYASQCDQPMTLSQWFKLWPASAGNRFTGARQAQQASDGVVVVQQKRCCTTSESSKVV